MSDDTIKRLRKAIAWLLAQQYIFDSHPKTATDKTPGSIADNIAALLDRLDKAERENKSIRDILLRNGFVECDIPACNCGSWHHRYGLPERFHEIKDALADAGHELSNANGNTTLGALNELIEQRDAAEAENERLREDAERLDWIASIARINSRHGTGYVMAIEVPISGPHHFLAYSNDDVRAAIDAAMAKDQK